MYRIPTPVRRSIRRLYRRCLQAANRCRTVDDRMTMKLYVQSRFREQIADGQAAKELVLEGTRDVERMEGYLQSARR